MLNIVTVTGIALSGLTDPTFTLTADVAPNTYSMQKAVGVLGGTQTGSAIHSIGNPFTITVSRPAVLKSLTYSPTGVLKTVPTNTYQVLTRKGLLVAAGVRKIGTVKTIFDIPAGVEGYDAVAMVSMISLHIGELVAEVAAIKSMLHTGIL